MPSHRFKGTVKPSKNSLVSTMIKQGFISDSPSLPLTPSPPSSHNSSPIPPLSRAITAGGGGGSISTTFSPPPPPPFNVASPTMVRTGPNPTLFEMMSEEQTRDSNIQARHKLQDRVFKVLADAPFQNSNGGGGGGVNNFGYADVKLSVAARDGFRISMEVHRRVLSSRSRFFSEKLRENATQMVSVEILECDDVEAYVEAVVLMYSYDLKKKLMGEEVSKVLELLKVCSAILFDDGISACLEYLEAIPWSEEEEGKVVSHLNELQLHDSSSAAPDVVLQRVVSEPSTTSSSSTDDIFLKLLSGVLEAKDDKARREMKILISRLLREDNSSSSSSSSCEDNNKITIDMAISRDKLYNLCHSCLSSLILSLSEATTCEDYSSSSKNEDHRAILMKNISREADNLQWVVEILIDRRSGEEFVQIWADQKELALLHSKIPTMYRHEISGITALLCIGIGKGHILVPKETRYSLISTWLEPLYEDFGWMKRVSRSIDKKQVEEGISQTILTLPLQQQKIILLNWFDRFLNKGDNNCPNIQRAFEVWWRRSFRKQQYVVVLDDSHLQLTPSHT